MSLSLSWWKQNWSRVLWMVLGILVLLFFVRVIIWEHEYYISKEGSERAAAPVVQSSVDETDVSDQQKTEYTVAPDRPRYLSIDKLGIKNSRVLAVGLKQNGQLDTPANIFDTAWYTASGKPGAGGTMLINGHNGGPTKNGVFKRLPDLQKGDIITVERGDGKIFRYSVVENNTVALEDSDAYMRTAQQTPVKGKESVTLISCTGTWSQAQQTYLSRQFVRAVLVE